MVSSSMIRLLLGGLGVLFLFLVNVDAKEYIVKDKIESVTVFMQNAQIFKQAKVSIPKGTSVLVFNDVSPYISRPSIQASGIGNFTITHTQYRYHMEVSPSKKNVTSPKALRRVKVLKDSIQFSQLRINKNTELLQAVDKESRLVLTHPLTNGNSKSDSLELLKGTAAFLREEYKELAEMKYFLSLKAKKLRDHHSSLQNELNELNALIQNQSIQPANKYHHQVIVTVYSNAATSGFVKLNYLTGQAGWSPQYDLKATNHQSDITLVYKAQIYQNTGTDWKQVKIKVSNANPNQGNTKPTLPTWFVNFQRFLKQKRTTKALYLEKASTSNIAEDAAEDIDFDEADLIDKYTTKVQNFSSVEFDISMRMNIETGGKMHYMGLRKEKVATQFQLYLVPKLEKDAFVVARLTGWESLDLLTGPANIYYGNTYIGKTVVDPSILEDTLEVSMGRDRSIYVERKRVSSETKKKLLENSKEYSAEYTISIKNKNSGEIDLIIEDHIPVSQNEKIEVSSTHGSGKLNKTRGLLSWDIKLSAHEKHNINYGYTIKYPKEEKISF